MLLIIKNEAIINISINNQSIIKYEISSQSPYTIHFEFHYSSYSQNASVVFSSLSPISMTSSLCCP